jgi:hypothetical protein
VAADFDRLYATLLAEGGRSGRGLAPRTVANIHTTLHAALEHALARGVVRSNPAAKAKKTSKRRRHAPRDRTLMVVDDIGEDPDRWLIIGPDRAANLLEVVVLVTAEGDEVIIHAMPLRATYRKLLDA